jgi:Chaperone of endosialidase
MPSQQKSTTTTNTPWSGAKPALKYGISEATRLYGKAPQYYAGSTVAGFTPYQNAAVNATGARSLYGNSGMNLGQGQINNILSGDLGLDAVYKNIESKVLPSAMSAYSAAGRTPGGAGSYGGYAAEQLTNAYAPVALQQMQGALNLAPTYAQEDWNRIDRLNQAGGQIQNQNQAQIQDSINRWNFYQNLPWDQLSKYLSSVQGAGAGYGSSTQPYYQNPYLSAAGGIAGLAGGIGSLLSAPLFASSREYKEDIEPVDGDTALETVRKLPIAEWQYKPQASQQLSLYGKAPDMGRHIGPMAEDWQQVTGLGDGSSIDLRDLVGYLAAGLSELADRVDDQRSR